MTDPGVVPPNWGFYMGDETKRRRYCKMCNVWKPDRTHHCSMCNRCILNMDHHCPWINNCVGFYNRKFFIQLLIYVFITLVMVVLLTIPKLVFVIRNLTDKKGVHDTWYCVKAAVIAIAFCMSLMLIFTLWNFINFHLKLVSENYTTIENLEKEEGAKSKFDVGRTRNREQVYGANVWLWWLPMHTQASRPIGDGVRWRVHYTRVIDEDEESSCCCQYDDNENNNDGIGFDEWELRRCLAAQGIAATTGGSAPAAAGAPREPQSGRGAAAVAGAM
eukprot:CAMPEP_0168429326 /NCGR_PEP_ID=MMETSP0228-20121227/37313_1 /TAXON_ID=133427 /ORGANISM="Protoceratium reticulatum, Strain CCCM 535 (=CCMP 1889)" /LENGTH=274 /DNA_ID=CAMNT_0008443409 /DNA_START=77 /DNA_END=899 /DNA_ORIENTATION=-